MYTLSESVLCLHEAAEEKLPDLKVKNKTRENKTFKQTVIIITSSKLCMFAGIYAFLTGQTTEMKFSYIKLLYTLCYIITILLYYYKLLYHVIIFSNINSINVFGNGVNTQKSRRVRKQLPMKKN